MSEELRRELERLELPGAPEAEERAWAVAAAAYAQRERPARRSWMQRARWLSPLRARAVLAAAAVLAVLAAAASPPGRAVLDGVREAVGVERAEPALFSLPSPGRLLVRSSSGVWLVQPDGSKRRLGAWREAAWSPHGRFVVAAGANELAALEAGGGVRWSLARPGVRHPAWGGTRTDTRIAYASGDALRVVAGDGSGDRSLFTAPDVADAPLAWVPESTRLLAHATQGIVRLLDVAAGGEEVWSAAMQQPEHLEWSRGGERLVAVSRGWLVVFDRRGRRVVRHELAGRATGAAVAPGGARVAIALRLRGTERSEVFTFSTERQDAPQRRLFSGAGSFGPLAWSPDGRWVLLPWREADQWVFVRADGAARIQAVSHVTRQFGGGALPVPEGWCCAQ